MREAVKTLAFSSEAVGVCLGSREWAARVSMTLFLLEVALDWIAWGQS